MFGSNSFLSIAVWFLTKSFYFSVDYDVYLLGFYLKENILKV